MEANEHTTRIPHYVKVENIYWQNKKLKKTAALFISYGHHILNVFAFLTLLVPPNFCGASKN
jgi:hypothetical protein